MVARLYVARVVIGSNQAADKKFMCFSQKSLRYAALVTGSMLTAVPRMTQPSTLRVTDGKWVSTYGWVILQMAMGKCSLFCSLHAASNVTFALWPTRWRPPVADRLSSRWPKVNSVAYGSLRIDSTINIVVVIIIIIIISINTDQRGWKQRVRRSSCNTTSRNTQGSCVQ